jgi:hypothetical protein
MRNEKTIRHVLPLLVLLVGLVALGLKPKASDCDGGKVVFKVSEFSASALQANRGQTVDLKWQYEPTNASIKEQKIHFISLGFGGTNSDDQQVEPNQRNFSYTFQHTVDVLLEATTTDGQTAQAWLKISLYTNFHFTCTVRGTDPKHPYLGYPYLPGSGGCDGTPGGFSDTTRLSFSNAFAFFDGVVDRNGNVVQENGLVDGVIPVLPEKYMFRALSSNFNESERFGMKQGHLYPFNVFNNPTSGLANVIIFGGTLVPDGEELSYKTNDGVGTGRTGVTHLEYVFMAIVVRLGFVAKTADIVDIQLANTTQGMVTTVNYNDFGSRTNVSGWDGGLSWYDAGLPDGTISGKIKLATSGWRWASGAGLATEAFVNITNLDFQLPFLPDTQLAGVLNN